jgi:hypothetical protein
MSHPRLNRVPQRHTQRGAAFIVMLVVMILGITAILTGSLSNAGLKISRDVKTAEALAQAKEALIGKSVTYDTYGNSPGNLPCPDTDDDGESDAGGSTCPQYIGRLPWKTLGLPDLRDAAGERLWYTLSSTLSPYAASRPYNNDTPGTLNLTGSYAESNLVAIVFAPGDNIVGQSRSDNIAICTTTGTSIKENRCAANYLEGSNDDPSPGAAPNVNYQNANAAIDFNDQLITISHDQLFSRVEKRVGNEIKKILDTYYATSAAYPYAAPFENPTAAYTTSSPATRPFIGSAGTNNGQLPMGAVWIADPGYSISGGSANVDCERRSGYNSLANARIRCDISSIVSAPTITISGTLRGLRLWRPHDLNDSYQVRVRRSGTSYAASDPQVAAMNATINYTIKANGDVDVVFSGQLAHSDIERIELRDVIIDSSVDPVDPAYAWFVRNNWHHVMYYAVSPGFVAGGGNSCNPLPGTPSCLTVTGNTAINNSRAALVMTGRTLAGAHPSATLSDYLEGENATPSDFTFENQARSATFNDQVIVVAP